MIQWIDWVHIFQFSRSSAISLSTRAVLLPNTTTSEIFSKGWYCSFGESKFQLRLIHAHSSGNEDASLAYYVTRFVFALTRCATGESWQEIMLACKEDVPCDAKANDGEKKCGQPFTYAYFVSFVFFCSFLVRLETRDSYVSFISFFSCARVF